MFLLTSCANTYVGGVKFDKLKQAKPKDIAMIGVGMVASFLTHEAGHIILLEAFNADYDVTFKHFGPYIEFEDSTMSNNEIRWVSRTGLLTQNIVGLFLPEDSFFTVGYVATSAIETISYPIRNRGYGDLYTLDKYNGNSSLEWGVYSLISGYNLFRIEW